MNERLLNKNSTIYTYKLLHRVKYSALAVYSYIAVLGLVYAYDWYRVDPLRLPACLIVAFIVQEVLARIVLTMKEERRNKNWSFRFRLPWLGPVPESYYPLSKFIRVNRQLFWVPPLLSLCLYPWLDHTTLLHLIFAQIWISLPRYWMMFLFRKYAEAGFIKINQQDTSCYLQ